jgi:hypothetical protein
LSIREGSEKTVEENVELSERVLSVPIALVLSLLSFILVVASLFLPWWSQLDSTLGFLRIIFLYRQVRIIPYELEEFAWEVGNVLLRSSMLVPLVMAVSSLVASVLNSYMVYRKRFFRGLLSYIGGACILLSPVLFTLLFSRYMVSLNDTVSGSMGFLKWGYGLGWRVPFLAAALMVLNGLLISFERYDFEIGVSIDSEPEEDE